MLQAVDFADFEVELELLGKMLSFKHLRIKVMWSVSLVFVQINEANVNEDVVQ